MMPADYKVLIADDDPAMLRLLHRWLTGAGYAVRAVGDGRDAIDAIESDCPDFIITDWVMPRLNGMELCEQVRKMSLPHYVYIIILTVKNRAEDLIAGLDNGADDFLAKPIAQGELLARMKSSARVLELERQLSRMAHTDALTGLLTQRCFYKLLEKEWHRSQRSHLPLSCVMMDLDYFKHVNDVHGHAVGDAMLKLVADLLLANCRASDTVCRYGGEEFGVMLPETDEKNAALWAERARERLAALAPPAGIEGLAVSGSFGVAECGEDLKNSEKLADHADQALLCAKRMGRNRVVCFSTLAAAPNPKSPAGILNQQDAVFQSHCARDLMTPLANCPRESDSIECIAEYLLRCGATAAPVLTASNALAGAVFEKDLLVALATPEKRRSPVSTVMRTNVVCYEADTPLRVIFDFLCRVALRELVITHRGQPVGIVNLGTMLQWFHDTFPGGDAVESPDAHSSAREDNRVNTASTPIHRNRDSAPVFRLDG